MKQLDLKTVADEMLSEMSGITRASENTLEAYSRDIKEFVNFCSEKEINSIDRVSERTIRHFIIRLNENESTKSTISRKLSSLRRLFLFAIKNEYIEKNPIDKIPNPKVTRKLPEIINVDSYLEIFSLVDKENEVKESRQIKAIFELLYGCALRVSELCSLDVGDVDFHGMSIRVLGKGSKVRVVPLGSKSAEVLKDYLGTLSAKSHSVPLFAEENGERITRHYVYRLVKKYLSKVTDIDKKSPHILRHSAATHMLDNEADIMAVKEILGHENLSTTQIYTHVSVERLKKSYKKAHPKS
ncbi:MAG: tyrosine-type recombinase/integrase [Bacteroidetes bacterium]|nr:tyrosine-type recombinase/integrase [Bacteroidota bacterium]